MFDSFLPAKDETLLPSLNPESQKDILPISDPFQNPLNPGCGEQVQAFDKPVADLAGDWELAIDSQETQLDREDVDRLTGEALQNFAADPHFTDKISLAFGENWNREVVKDLQQDWLSGDFSDIPQVQILSGDVLGSANGAYSRQTNTIYLSRDFLTENAANPAAVADVLLEEYGHAIDAKINAVDAAGDEGDIFSKTVRGQALSGGELLALKVEDDSGMITLDGKTLQIEKDDTPQTAPNLGIFTGTRTFYNSVSPTDNYDYYRFSLNSTTQFNLLLNGLQADANVEVGTIGSDGSLRYLADSHNSGTQTESINRTLAPGDYYVLVLPYDFRSSTNYNLTLSATSTTPLDNAGNSLNLARNIGTLSGTQTFGDFVGTADTDDYYRFSLNNTSDVSLTLNGLSGDADVELIRDANNNGIVDSGDVLRGSYAGGTTPDSLSMNLSAGTYFTRVYPMGGVNTNYNLSLSAVPSAVPIGLYQTLSGTLSTTDLTNPTRSGTYRDDYLLTGVSAGQQVRVNLNSSGYDNYLQVINAATGQVVTFNDDANNSNNAEVTFTVEAGVNYLLRATSYSGSVTGSYSITTSTVAPPTVTLTASDVSAAETNTGQILNPGQFTFTRTGSLTSPLTVNYFINGTAANSSDYSSIPYSVTFAAGQSSVNVPINVIDDTLVEASETVSLSLATSSAYTLGTSNSATVTIADNDTVADWFDLNIQDVNLRSLARSRSTDNVLDRNDMIAIFQDAKDNSVIDGTELTDLRTLVSNASRFNMPDYVRVLSNKVANSDVANTNSGIGNLFGGSSATQMDNLIGKWFRGTDLPDLPSTYVYRPASGSLFQSGVNYQDINQGALGDCYFLAGLAAAALRTPNTIQNMFIDNGDNTFTVRFFNNGLADYVTVDRQLPTTYLGSFAYANASNELWVALAEKAYAQINESGWLGEHRDRTNSYLGINGGLGVYSMRHITGRNTNSEYVPSGITNITGLINTFNLGQLVTLGSKQDGSVASNVVPQHEYTLVGYNTLSQTFTLFNPWGVNGGNYQGIFKPGLLNLTASQLTASFDYWASTTNYSQPQLGTNGTLPPPRFAA